MRIKFIKHDGIKSGMVGMTWQGAIRGTGHTIVNGYIIAINGILKDWVEDITQYTLDEEGNKVEVTEMKPDKSWFVSDIKLWLDAQEIPYTSKMLKPDLLELA
jgi:hypothetical protein